MVTEFPGEKTTPDVALIRGALGIETRLFVATEVLVGVGERVAVLLSKVSSFLVEAPTKPFP